MGLEQRLKLYVELEKRRTRPLIVYVTSNRPFSNGQMASDVVPEILAQLQELPPETKALDLLIVSNGGDPTVAWRVVSLIRERVQKFAVLLPQAAFSAATLVALGADEIVMHPHGNLGPVDPQISVTRRPTGDGPPEQLVFGSEDLAAFLRFAREQVGLTDQAHVRPVFELFCQEVGLVPIGVANRSAQLAIALGERLLLMHMKGEGEKEKARAITETLNKNFFHHGYPLSRTEAAEIGLKVADRDEGIEDLLWNIWLDIEAELQIREPFNPVTVLKDTPACQAIFAPIPQVTIPSNLPPQVLQQAYQQVLQQIQVTLVPPAPYILTNALMESPRLATRFVVEGSVYACRQPDLQIRLNLLQERSGWRSVDLPKPTTAPGNPEPQG